MAVVTARVTQQGLARSPPPKIRVASLHLIDHQTDAHGRQHFRLVLSLNLIIRSHAFYIA
ncbi:hypothetical protein FHS72_003581 [Loktanella ponticola]|uniref:Uncharacterized protein n=1 Tax=Yoonia ponticola TaxID=1524255 RepID=A0A7W9BNU5_9RHOB|nr:hypothetical protein [Yoonia ponticola]